MKNLSKAKTANVLIVNPPMTVERDFIDYPYFANLGALQHSAVAAVEGFNVTVADSFSFPGGNVFPLDDGRFQAGCPAETLLSFVKGERFGAVVVCVSVFHRPFCFDNHLAAFFRSLRKMFPDTPVAAADAYFRGMHYVDYSGAEFLGNYPEVDALLHYETESAMVEWLKEIAPKGRHERRIITGEAPGDLENMPPPSWNLISVKNYLAFLDLFLKSTGRWADFSDIMPVLPVVTSRGCLYSCSFCSGTNVPQRQKHRQISPGRLQKELKVLKSRYGIRGIAILDGLANAVPGAFAETLEVIRAAGLKVSFVNGLRADHLKKSHVKALSLISPSLTVSAESASDRIRNDVLKKRLKLSSIEKTAAWCSESGLPLGIHYMIGIPGETIAEVNTTLDHAHRMSVEFGAEPLIQFCVPQFGAAQYGEHVFKNMSVAGSTVNRFRLSEEKGEPTKPDEPDTACRMLHFFRMRMRESFPEKLIINLTYRCNNRCEICAVGGRPRRNMSFETCTELIKEYYARGVTMLDIDGGEPTLHPDLLMIVGTACEMGYTGINVTTNGRKLAARDFASRLLLSGITDIHVSVYGPDTESHERVTRTKGSFAETAFGIRNIVRLKPERVGLCVNTVLTASNYMLISELMKWLADLGVEALDVQFPTPFGSAREDSLPPFDKALEEFEKAADKFKNVLNLNLVNLPPCKAPAGWPMVRDGAEKYGRHMAFVDAAPQNLGAYLSSKRRRVPSCLDCEHYIVCEGFYVFDK